MTVFSVPGIYLVHLAPNLDIKTDDLIDRLEPATRFRVSRFKFEHDKLTAVFSDLLIKYLLANIFSLEIKDMIFSTRNSGKPFIALENVEFNISHSGDLVVCAIDSNAIGIDIEKIKDINLTDAGFFLSPEDKEWVYATKEIDRLSLIYNIWTTKEAYLKAEGKRLDSVTLSDFSVKFDLDAIGLMQFNKLIQGWNFTSLNIRPGYSATICSRSKKICTEVNLVSVSNIIKWTKKLSSDQ